ncbi:hypothetical protein PENSPDRAFT_755937 [Peniophora sp. CONT]|nr:hypothetical protein PENSPDRAFT_755937 [Peniophora sp. CONT]
MDDPWGNAWGEPSTSSPTTNTWDVKPVTTLTTSPALEEEADLGGASAGWTLDGAVRWDEGDAWGSSNSAWKPEDTFSNIKLDTPVVPEPEHEESEPASPISEPEPEPGVEELPTVTLETPNDDEEYVSQPASAPRSPDPDADGFGTFNDGEEPAPAAAPWSPVAPAFPDDTADGWGTSAESAWGATNDTEEKEEEEDEEDEWTRAARAKAALDRALPPELLASIMLQVQELADAAWPSKEGQDEKDVTPDWASSWLAGMDGVPDLDALLSRYVPPDQTLPPPTRFTTTHTSRSLSSSLKLTRHTLPARNSPFASLMAARGSAAWEAAVKARSMPTAETDVDIPAGWRILEKDERKDEGKEGEKEEKKGLFASLWGRRSSSMKPQTTGGSIGSTGSARQSVEILSPVSISSTNAPTPQRSASPAPSMAPTPASSVPTPTPAPAEPAPTQPTPNQPYDSPAFEPILPPDSTTSPPPSQAAPSGVSRFFSRLTRTRTSSPSPRSSLALSGDDIEFLGDIVPSASDPDDGDDLLGMGGGGRDLKMAGLESMLRSKPVGGKLPAPLPPPPPPGAATPRPVSSTSIPQVPRHTSRPSQDLFAGFDVLRPSSGSTQPSASTSNSFQSLSQSDSTASSSILHPAPSAPSISTVSSSQPLAQSTSSSAFDDDDDFADFLGSPSAHSGPSAARGGGGGMPESATFGDFASFTGPSGSNAAPPSSTFGDFSSFGASSSSAGAVPSSSFGDFGGFMATPTLAPTSAANVASPPQPLAPPPSAVSSLTPQVGYGKTLTLPPPGSSIIAPLPPPGSSTISPLPPPVSAGAPTPPLPPPSAGMSSLMDRRLSRPIQSSSSPIAPPLARAPSIKTGKPLSITPPSLDLFNADAGVTDGDGDGAGKSGVEASHTRTRSLLESAQARAGIRWPAPPSPLPEALSPPPDAPPTFAAAGVDLLGGGGGGFPSMQTFSPPSQPSRALSPPVQALSPPPLTAPPAHKMPPALLHSLAPPPDLFDAGAGMEDTPPPTPRKPDFGSFARQGQGSRPSSTIGSSTFSPPSNSSVLPPTLSPPNSSTLPSAVGISRFPHQSSLPAPASTSRPSSRVAHRSVTMSTGAPGAGGPAPLLPPPPGGGSPFATPPRAPSAIASPPAMTMTPPTAALSPPPSFAPPSRPHSALSPPPGFTASPAMSAKMTPPTASLSPPPGFAPPSRNTFASPPPSNSNAFATRGMTLSPPTRNGSPEDSVPLAALVQQRQTQQVQSVVKGTGGLSASDLSFFEGL